MSDQTSTKFSVTDNEVFWYLVYSYRYFRFQRKFRYTKRNKGAGLQRPHVVSFKKYIGTRYILVTNRKIGKVRSFFLHINKDLSFSRSLCFLLLSTLSTPTKKKRENKKNLLATDFLRTS